MSTMIHTLRYKGRMYRIPAVPFETQERLADRAWYVAKSVGDSLSTVPEGPTAAGGSGSGSGAATPTRGGTPRTTPPHSPQKPPATQRGGRTGSDGGAEILSESHRWANQKYFKMQY